MRNMSNSEIDGILKRLRELRKQPGATEMVVNPLIDSICEYTSSVFEDNYKKANLPRLRENSSSLEEYQEKVEQIELNRKYAHDRLIVSLRMADMVCRMNGIDEIYGEFPEEYKQDAAGLLGEKNRDNPGVAETRHAIADWTWGFITGAVISMDIDIDGLDYHRNAEDRELIGNTFNKGRAGRLLRELTDPGR